MPIYKYNKIAAVLHGHHMSDSYVQCRLQNQSSMVLPMVHTCQWIKVEVSEIEGKQQTVHQKVQNKMWKYCQNGEKDERIMFTKIDLREEIIFILQHSWYDWK